MKKWEYKLLIALWDFEKYRFYWADDEYDQRNVKERLTALREEGWEIVSAFSCGIIVTQHNYLLRRLNANGNDVSRLQSRFLMN